MCCMINAVMTDMESIHLDMKRHLWRDLVDSPLERCRYNTISLSMEDMDVLRMSVQVELVPDLSSTNPCNILCDRRRGRPAPTG